MRTNARVRTVSDSGSRTWQTLCGDRRRLRGDNRIAHDSGRSGDDEVLHVVSMGALPDAFTARVVDPDLGADVPAGREGNDLDMTARRAPFPHLFGAHPTFVRTRHHH